MTDFRPSGLMGIASAATTDGPTTPRYGLAYDLSSGQWTNAAQFQQFIRDVLPVTQQAAQQQTQQIAQSREHFLELQRAQLFDQHGIEFNVTPEEAIAYSHANNLGKAGFQFKKGAGILSSAFKGLGSAASNLVRGDADLPDHPYEEYTKRGGLLTEEEFNAFGDNTKARLIGEARLHSTLHDLAGTPILHQGLQALGAGYRGLTTGAEMAGTVTNFHSAPAEFFSPDRWAKAWRESQNESLGNALINIPLDNFYSQEKLDRWKRDNPWYQMTSTVVELGATWYADPVALGGKGLGAAARFSKAEFPIRENSSYAIALRQATQNERITVSNPVAKGYAKVQARRIENNWNAVEQAAQAMSPSEFAQLPMFKQRYRAQDGGAAAYALHWAANNKATINEAIKNSPGIQDALSAVGEAKDFTVPHIDAFDLTKQLVMGDPKAFAMLSKLQSVPPEELQRIAPGAGSLLDSMDALKTRADVLQTEVDDLLTEADAIGQGTSQSKALPMFHQWEVHTSLADKQRQLSEATDALSKYEGYQNWLDLVTGPKGNPVLSRVQGPTRKRWSEIRNRPEDGATETRSLFTDNQFGYAHSFHRMPKALFIKRANTVEIHSLDSGLMSINRQFDQFEHLFGYAPAGARDDFLNRYVKANSAYDRYKALHDLEEEHLVGGVAHRFGIDPEVARTILHKINDERNRTIDGILSGQGAMYRSAPSIMDRLSSGTDTSLQLVSKDQETGTMTVNLMHGRHKQTFEVPEAAFEKRVAPEDITQTPNYYNPLDTRRLYHELKHDPKMLEELNANFLAHGKAALADTVEWAGTKFNQFWKPIQLFRLGWPMRVLMDEGARATAIFGPFYWLTGAGADSVYTAGRNVLPNTTNAIARKRRGPLGISMGDGSVTKAFKQNPNQIVRDAEVREAVQVPQSLWTKINPARLEKIKSHYDVYDTWDRANLRKAAWAQRTNNGVLDPIVDNALATGQPLTPLQNRLVEYGIQSRTTALGSNVVPDNPLFTALRKRGELRDGEPPRVIDAGRGTPHRSGYIVPLGDNYTTKALGAEPSGRALMEWYNQNSELLARSGMRLVIHNDGTVAIGRHFTANRFTDAQHFAQYVSETHPDVEMWDLGKKKSFRVQDANDLSSIAQATYRYFANEEKVARTPGKAPVEGEPAVYHGTDQDLPADLRPRGDAPVINGRMMGDGLYTTTSNEIAESYGSRNLYTIRGSKTGKQYKVWDADQPVEKHIADLKAWLDEQRDVVNAPHRTNAIDDLHAILDNPPHMFYSTVRGKKLSWSNLYEDASANGDEGPKLLHDYLEKKHGVGALTHKGGTTHGHPHQVYIWLHPQDLVVKPLYAGTGEYWSLPQWFSHPASVENVMPESQIIRKGHRNPMLRELRTIANQLDNNFEHLTGNASAALMGRERELMDALGLKRRSRYGNGAPADVPNNMELNALLPKRYAVVDKGHFERMVDEARTEDEARTFRAAANGDLRAQEQVAALGQSLDLSGFDFEINSPTTWLFNKIRERREQGSGWKRIHSADGKSTVVPAAFEGHQGQLFRGLTASNGALDVLSEGHGQGTSMFRRKVAGYRAYAPPAFTEQAIKNPMSAEGKRAIRYFQVYADTINDHLGSSPIIQRMLRGQSEDEIVNWLETSVEGQRILRDVKPKEMPTGIWVDDHKFKLNYYVPSKKLQRLLGKGRLSPSDFRKNIADEDLPTIYGPDLEVLDRRRGAGQFLSDWADKAWEYLGNKPIDAFSRHPFAKAMYDSKMKNLIRSTDSKWLDEETLARFQNQSQTFALNETRRMLYNLTETTNFNDALRFIAPFWGAQYEAISKWLRIISDRPETIGRFFAAQRGVYNNFVVVDPTNDHKEVKSGTRPGGLHGLGMYHPNDMVIMPIPGVIKKRFGMEGIGKVGIPIGSANTVLQGDLPLFPSLGPLVTIPADQFLRKVSDTYGVENDQNIMYRWLFPIGRPRSKDAINQMLDQFVPGWINRVRQGYGPEDTAARFNMETLIGREMILKARREGKPDPTPEQIAKAGQHLWNIRIVSGLIQPFQTQFLPDHQYWIDAAHRYQKQYGNEWWDKFIDKYGDEAAIFATSSSNAIGVPPTAQGMEEWSANKKLIAKYPNWTSAIISPQAYMSQFSSDAYGQQFNITLGPGDSRTLRSGSSVVERLYNDPETQLGWREYRKLNAALEAELHARGLTSIQQSGAEQLALLKQAGKADIAKKYPAWARAFQSQADTINADVTELQNLAGNPIFDNRPDWQGVRQYLTIRQQVTDLLDAYTQQGGSRSLQAQENGALRDWFYNQVGQLVLDNPAFAEFYSRYLDNDTLTMGSGF